jgi:hypothetical protein
MKEGVTERVTTRWVADWIERARERVIKGKKKFGNEHHKSDIDLFLLPP